MLLLCLCIWSLVLVRSEAYTDPHCVGQTSAIVHLFEWKWSDIERECSFLADAGFCAVQTSVATENKVVPGHPWWERYQPVSYKIASRSGNESQFANMVKTCNDLGIRIYVDVELHHLAEGAGQGIAGSEFGSSDYYYPAIPFDYQSFYHTSDCATMTDKFTSNYIRYCSAFPSPDRSKTDVQKTMAAFLNHFVELGVAGFRVDSAKHMFPGDLKAIYDEIKDVNWGGRPFFINEVTNTFPSAVAASEYYGVGYVTDFRYADAIGDFFNSRNLSEISGVFNQLIPSNRSLLFVDNHATQRGRHRPGATTLTHRVPKIYQQAQAFTLALGYGIPRVMSSYYFSDIEAGPPHTKDFDILDVTVKEDGSCGSGWVCEHRWDQVRNMVKFSKEMKGTQLRNFKSSESYLSFGRGDKGFFAMRLYDSKPSVEIFNTGLPEGDYCNLITNCMTVYKVNIQGKVIIDFAAEPTVALVKVTPTTKSSHTAHPTLPHSGLTEEHFIPTSSIKTETSTELFDLDTTVKETHDLTTTKDIFYTTDTQIKIDTTYTDLDLYSIVSAQSRPITTDALASTTERSTPVEFIDTTQNVSITHEELATSSLGMTSSQATTNFPTTTEEPTTEYIRDTETTATTTSLKPPSTTNIVTSWRRTVILMERQTQPGQDLFIRGGLDFKHMSGCQHIDQNTNPCAIPIRHRSLPMLDKTPARDAWAKGDNFLDWDGPEPGQETYKTSWIAQGTPGQWTTNIPNAKYYNPLNSYGNHYWIVDVDMDCSKTLNGFFEFKAMVNNEWENGERLDATCSEEEGQSVPYPSDNHFGRCGYINVFHWGSGLCEIKDFPDGSQKPPIIG